jgi:hypothetical protein
MYKKKLIKNKGFGRYSEFRLDCEPREGWQWSSFMIFNCCGFEPAGIENHKKRERTA